MNDRIAQFVLSTGNLVGCGAALGVVSLFLADVIGSGWGWMAVGAYVAAALPLQMRDKPPAMPEGLQTAQVLDWLAREALPKMPVEARKVLGDILERLHDLMPRLKTMEAEGIVDAQARAQFKNTIVRLLPDAVGTYLKLPTAYARLARLPDGNTPQGHLTAQLLALQTHVQQLENDLLSPYINQMLINTRFLDEKVHQSRPIMDLEPPSPTTLRDRSR